MLKALCEDSLRGSSVSSGTILMILLARGHQTCVQLQRLQKDLHSGSLSQDIVKFPPELCRRRSVMFMEVARLLPPELPWPLRRDDPHPSRSVAHVLLFGRGWLKEGEETPATRKHCVRAGYS